MTKIDCIKKLAESYEQKLRNMISDPNAQYTVTSDWLVEQYIIAFTEGVEQGLNYNVILRKEQQEIEKNGVDAILKKTFDSNDAYKDLAKKVNMD